MDLSDCSKRFQSFSLSLSDDLHSRESFSSAEVSPFSNRSFSPELDNTPTTSTTSTKPSRMTKDEKRARAEGIHHFISVKDIVHKDMNELKEDLQKCMQSGMTEHQKAV